MKLGTFYNLFKTEIDKTGISVKDFRDKSEESAATVARQLVKDQATLRSFLTILNKNYYEGSMLCEALGEDHLKTLFANDVELTQFLYPLDPIMQAALCGSLKKEFHPMKLGMSFHKPAPVEMKQREDQQQELTPRMAF
jgi:hypothetical protein